MATLASGQSVTLYLSADQYLTLDTSAATEGSLAVTPQSGVGSVANTQTGSRFGPSALVGRQYGPYGTAVQVVLASVTGAITYVQSGEGFTRDSSGNITGLEANNGRVISLSSAPKDFLVTPIQHVDITAAISTTVAASATATGTYYNARVVWNNNGASGTAKLNIAVNSDNAVHGLVASQNAKRRDYQMTMGDGVLLICETPISIIYFSSDMSITSNTHQLQVTFGN